MIQSSLKEGRKVRIRRVWKGLLSACRCVERFLNCGGRDDCEMGTVLRKSHQLVVRGGRWGDKPGQTGKKPKPCICTVCTVACASYVLPCYNLPVSSQNLARCLHTDDTH